MSAIFELLESEGFVQDSDALRAYELSATRVRKLYKKVYSVVFKAQYSEPADAAEFDAFSYTASASMRGDLGCWEIPCRLEKIDFLNNFAALYSNQVAVPLLLDNPDDLKEISNFHRQVLSLSLLTLLRSRPLIEAGIVRPTVMRTAHCPHDLELVEGLAEAAHAYVGVLARSYVDQFEAVYQLPTHSPSGKSTIYLSGSSDFLEHDMVQLFAEGPNWRLKSWKYNREGKVRLSGPRKHDAVSRIFESIASNTTFFLAYGMDRNSRFLSDRKGEILLLTDPEETTSGHSSSPTTVFRQLTHALPLLADASLADIVRIRKEDRESFAAYQHEITALTREALDGNLSKSEAREAFKSKLLPKITRIEKELATERSKLKKYLGFGTAGIAASVAIGAFGLPLLTAVPVATVATGLLAKGVQRAVEATPEIKQNNDLYFLVRLLQQAH